MIFRQKKRLFAPHRGVCVCVRSDRIPCHQNPFPLQQGSLVRPASNWMARANEDPSSLLCKRTCRSDSRSVWSPP